MATTVTGAFDLFLSDIVRVSKPRSDVAKASKATLISEISKFPTDGKFPLLHPEISIDYGSFSRKTKTRPLDDIDIMIILHAQGGTHHEYFNHIEIHISPDAQTLKSLCNDDTYTLNSRKVINKFKDYLWSVSKYEKADIKRNQEAVTLNLSSYEWVYDIVPCFMSSAGDGTTFFLIPDGAGNWKKTDPRMDKERTSTIHNLQTVSVLDIIRIFKYWTKRPTMPTIKSYFLENLILNYYNSGVTSVTYVDIEIPKVLAYIYHNIYNSLNDPKGFQGNINHLNDDEKGKIKEKAGVDYHKAIAARKDESDNKIEEAIIKWSEIFGDKFPVYS